MSVGVDQHSGEVKFSCLSYQYCKVQLSVLLLWQKFSGSSKVSNELCDNSPLEVTSSQKSSTPISYLWYCVTILCTMRIPSSTFSVSLRMRESWQPVLGELFQCLESKDSEDYSSTIVLFLLRCATRYRGFSIFGSSSAVDGFVNDVHLITELFLCLSIANYSLLGEMAITPLWREHMGNWGLLVFPWNSIVVCNADSEVWHTICKLTQKMTWFCRVMWMMLRSSSSWSFVNCHPQPWHR